MSTRLDDVLAKQPFMSRYYVTSLVLFFIANLVNSVHTKNFVFAVDGVGYRCKNERFGNNTCELLENFTVNCTQWIYDDPNTFVAEFQLACQDWKRTLVGTAHSFGYMVGLLIVGPLSDRLGRKKLVVVTGMLGGVLGLARSFATWYWLYIALEFLEGVIGDTTSPVFMLTIEIVAKEKRVLAQMLCSYGFMAGSVTLSLLSWLIPYYRTMLRVVYIPGLLIFFYQFLLDESPRWLLSKGRKEEAIIILKKIAKQNKTKIDNNELENIAHEENKSTSFIELLKVTVSSKTLLKRFVICLIWWITCTFVNYGISINSVFLQGNKYINFALVAMVAIPGNLVIIYILYRVKRKTALFCSFIGTALLLVTQTFVPTNLPWLSILMFMVGSFMSKAYFDITYIYTSEIFPTYTRNSMHALCSSLGRIGSIIASQTPALLVYWHSLPSLVFGLASLLAGLVTLAAPNTSHDALPDNVQQAEALGDKKTNNSLNKTSIRSTDITRF